MRQQILKQNGFTLAEVLMATVLLVVIFSGVMVTFFRCLELNEVSSNTSMAILAAKNRLAEIEKTTFTQIDTNFDNIAFSVDGINGTGVTYIDDSTPGILTIRAAVSWRQTNGRIYGEDTDLDGRLDAGEDLNGNSRLDSIVELETFKFDT